MNNLQAIVTFELFHEHPFGSLIQAAGLGINKVGHWEKMVITYSPGEIEEKRVLQTLSDVCDNFNQTHSARKISNPRVISIIYLPTNDDQKPTTL